MSGEGWLLALGGLVLYNMATQQQQQQSVGASGLSQQQFNQAVVTDNSQGSAGSSLNMTVASNILNAPNASQALLLGNASLQGLDLTNPASVAVYEPTPVAGVPISQQLSQAQILTFNQAIENLWAQAKAHQITRQLVFDMGTQIYEQWHKPELGYPPSFWDTLNSIATGSGL